MKAVIMAAGKSTRTYPLTLTKPKPLLKILNKEIIIHNLEQLKGIVDEVILVVGYKQEMIRNRLDKTFEALKIIYVEQLEQLGTGHALQMAKDHLQQPFLVLLGDDIYWHDDLAKLAAQPNSVLVKEVEDVTRFGLVELKNDCIIALHEKSGQGKGFVNTGAMCLTPEVFAFEFTHSERGELELTQYIHETKPKAIIATHWLPISYPWNLLDATQQLIERIEDHRQGAIEQNVTINGKVIIGEGTVIKSGSYIEGPVVIGKNCTIGPNCFVRAGTVIDNNSKIGHACEVKNSIIGTHTSIGHLSYIGDSVLGDYVNLGAGTITANLRHDDQQITTIVKNDKVNTGRRKLGAILADHVHTGINTSFYPGRKMWPSTTTLPGEVVQKDKMDEL